MVLRIFLLFLFFMTLPLATYSESPKNKESIKQVEIKPPPTLENVRTIPPGTYKGPDGQEIVVKESIINGGEVNDLSSRGIIIIDSKPTNDTGRTNDSSERDIIIVNIKDGIYTGPGGESFTVKNGIIIIDN